MTTRSRSRALALVLVGSMMAACGGRSLPAGDGGAPRDGAPGDAATGDGTVPHDGAAADRHGDGATSPGGGLTPDPGLLTCGAAVCTTATQLCCIGDDGTVGCVPDDARCNGLERACDEAADCAAGYRCCVPMTARIFPAYRTQCAPDCSMNQGFFFQVCKTSSECPSGVDCLLQRCDAETVQTCGRLDPGYCR